MKKSIRSLLLGLGTDCRDGHTRITKGKNFRLYGGSRQTHEKMQEKAVKFDEHLRKRGKTLEEISNEEFYEIAAKIGFKAFEEEFKE
jgi:hypothetical protein